MSTVLLFDNKEYIASRDAAHDSGYSIDYISKLCRSKKLNAKLIGKNWFVEKESLDFFLAHLEPSKQENQERLSKERKADYQSAVVSRKLSEVGEVVLPQVAHHFRKSAYGALSGAVSVLVIGVFYVASAGGLGMLAERTNTLAQEFAVNISVIGDGVGKLAVGTFENAATVSNFAGALVSNNPDAWGEVATSIDALKVEDALTHLGNESENATRALASVLTSGSTEIANAFTAGLNAFALEIHRSFIASINSFFGKFAGVRTNNVAINTVPTTSNEPTSNEHEGMVVVPGTGNQAADAEKIANIQNTFSDDVAVIPSVDGKSGIIRPEFKDKNGSDYLYVLVPLEKNGNSNTQSTP